MQGLEIGNWIVERRLNRGGMGEVFAAKHRTLDTPAAVKVLRPEHANVDEFRKRFESEAQTQAKLRHPSIARVIDYVEKDGAWYLVMELLQAGSLRDELARVGGPLPAEDVLDWAQEALEGLAHVHAAGIVHRDLKPDNILLNEHRRAVVTDFGIARAQEGPQMTATGMTVGTPAYMSPEQMTRPAEIDARTDVFAMGVVIYELLTAQLPFGTGPDSIYRQLEGRATPLRSLRPDLSPELERVLAMALHRDPRQRFANAGELLRALLLARGLRAAAAAAPTAAPEAQGGVPAGATATMVSGFGAAGLTVLPGDAGGGTLRFQAAAPLELDRPAPSAQRRARRGWLMPAIAALVFAGAGLALMNPFRSSGKNAASAASPAALPAAAGAAALAPPGSSALPPVAAGAISPEQIARMTPAQRQALQQAQRAQGLPDNFPPGMTAEQLQQMQVAGVSQSQLPPGMTAEQAKQLQAMPAAGVGPGQLPPNMTPEQAKQLQAMQAAGGIKPGQLPPNMTPEQAKQLQAMQAAGVSPGALPPNLTPEQMKQMQQLQAAGITPAQMQQMQAAGMAPGMMPPLGPLPANPVVAVVAGGEPLMAASLEEQIETRLRRSGFDVRDELNSAELAEKLAEGKSFSARDAQTLARDGFHVLVMLQVIQGKKQEFEIRKFETAAFASQVRMNARLLLSGAPLGRGWTELVEYTEISAQAKAERSLIGSTAELMEAIRETWDKLPKG